MSGKKQKKNKPKRSGSESDSASSAISRDIDVDNAYMTSGARQDILKNPQRTKFDTEKKILKKKLRTIGVYASPSLDYRKQPIML